MNLPFSMRRSVRWLAAAMLALPLSTTAEQLTIERLFEAPDLAGPTLRGLKFSPDSRLVTYLKAKPDQLTVFDLWAYDTRTKSHRLLVDSKALQPVERALSAEEEARRERQRTAALRGIVEYYWAPDSQSLLFPLGGDLYVYDLRRSGATAARQLTATDAFETDPKFSPKGRFVSFIRDQDLFVVDLTTGKERALTTDGAGLVSNGVAEFVAQEEMGRSTGYWWAPDDSRIAFARVDDSPVQEVDRFEIYATEARVVKQRYPAAGTPNAMVALGVVTLGDGAVTWLDLGPDTDIYLARVDWTPDAKRVWVQRQARDQQRLDLLDFPATGGAPRTVLTETSTTWVDLHDDLRFLPERRQFLWTSERSGTNHLYLYDYDGRPVRQLTEGDWTVVGSWIESPVVGVDQRRGHVYFVANRTSTLERHLYRVPLGGGEPQQVTSTAGWHAITMSPDASLYLDSFSSPSQPPQQSLHRSNGQRIAWLSENRLDESHPYAAFLPQHSAPEFGTVMAEDGTPLNWMMIKPKDFDPARRYPVIVEVYGGPTVQVVQRAWGGRRGGLFAQLLAQQGYIVFSIDNRGSGGRGLKFASQLYQRMGGVEVKDQLAGVDFLKTLPYIDADRIGVWGWSYGGFMTLMMVMQAPDTFRAGVSGAPVTDWSLYDTHYTERYLAHPKDNAAGYTASSVFPYVGALKTPLLIMHGMADDNVLFTNSTKLFSALTEANRQFDSVTYPGSKHAALAFEQTGKHGYRTILRYFDTHLKGKR